MFHGHPTFLEYRRGKGSTRLLLSLPMRLLNNELNRPPNGEEPDDEFMSDEDGVPETIFGSSSLVPNHRDELYLFEILTETGAQVFNAQVIEFLSSIPVELNKTSQCQNVVKCGGLSFGCHGGYHSCWTSYGLFNGRLREGFRKHHRKTRRG
ncbi:hypothetical protein Tco_1145158 [Tanacetum coccineum]